MFFGCEASVILAYAGVGLHHTGSFGGYLADRYLGKRKRLLWVPASHLCHF